MKRFEDSGDKKKSEDGKMRMSRRRKQIRRKAGEGAKKDGRMGPKTGHTIG